MTSSWLASSMKASQTLVCVVVLAGLISARIIDVYPQTEGGNITIRCFSSSASSGKFFCRGPCALRDMLVETSADRAESGRYSIEWRRTRESSSGEVFVGISGLNKSDSGRYRCGWGSFLSSPSYKDVEIVVVDALLDGQEKQTLLHAKPGGSITVACSFNITRSATVRSAFLCFPGKCWYIPINTSEYTLKLDRRTIRYTELFTGTVYVTVSHLTQSDSGRYRCGLHRFLGEDVGREFGIKVADDGAALKLDFKKLPSVPPAGSGEESPSLESEGPSPSAVSSDSTTQYGAKNTDGLLYWVVTLVVAVIALGLSLTVVCFRLKVKSKGRRNTDDMDMEIPNYENCPSGSACGESTYESLNPATRDQDQTYSTLPHQ